MVPFLKWAGGKRWLFTPEFVQSIPSFARYVEPFLGGGAGFFALEPTRALLSDINEELIELYRVVRDYPGELIVALDHHQAAHSEGHFYRTRSERPKSRIARAARTLYLNRTCWNGLYRLNRRGAFNVPIGTKTAVALPSDNFHQASAFLQSADIVVSDFEFAIDKAGEGDLLFVDPPYTVKHNMNGFVKYNETIFSWSDQLRLKDALVRASRRGASIIITNADHHSVRELYSGFGQQVSLERASIISGKSTGRSLISELMVKT
jgi:DNA adenine methylase